MSTIDASISRRELSQRRTAGFGRRLARAVVCLATRWACAMERRRSRLMLLELTDEQLKDIGISRADAYREGVRSWWE